MHKRYDWQHGILLCCLLTLLAGCSLADIRPNKLAEAKTLSAQQRQKGLEVIKKMQEAHGGLSIWQAHKNAQVVLIDTWPSLMTRTFGMPWSTNGAKLRQTMLLGKDISRLEFLNGSEKGSAWGIQHWMTYTVKKDALPEFDEHEDAKFYLPTIQYFFEAPFRLHEAQYIGYGGTKKLGKKVYDLVYLTWGSVEPNEKSDQYVLWVDRGTNRLAFLSFTVRDLYGFIQSAAVYKDYKSVQGILVPGTITVVSGMDDLDSVVHEMKFKSVAFGVDLPTQFLVPQPNRRGKK